MVLRDHDVPEPGGAPPELVDSDILWSLGEMVEGGSDGEGFKLNWRESGESACRDSICGRRWGFEA